MSDNSRKTITLVGQAKSGKTNLLATLLTNTNSLRDLTTGPKAVRNPAIRAVALPDTPEARARDALTRHYTAMLYGRDDRLAATEKVTTYTCELEFSTRTVSKPGLLASMTGTAGRTRQTDETIVFDLVDGRGGDIAKDNHGPDDDMDDDLDVNRKNIQDYRDALVKSSGHIIFMPFGTDEYNTSRARRFEMELQAALENKRSNRNALPLERVALCFTKYEKVFVANGDHGYHRATDPAMFLDMIRDHEILNVFRPLLRESLAGDGFEMEIFPVSTFGFVARSGVANFYPYRQAPGLLTRAVDEYRDYGNQQLPDYKDHFPFPVSEANATTMWQPFNIAPPVLFALTGRRTGPISLSAREVLAE